MFPMALVCGNTMLMKPSERDPGCTMMLMELVQEAGFPPGVVNVIHGTHDSVNFICDHPAIKAISFVGSDQAGTHIYERGSKNGKRVQSNMGAKVRAFYQQIATSFRRRDYTFLHATNTPVARAGLEPSLARR